MNDNKEDFSGHLISPDIQYIVDFTEVVGRVFFQSTSHLKYNTSVRYSTMGDNPKQILRSCFHYFQSLKLKLGNRLVENIFKFLVNYT